MEVSESGCLTGASQSSMGERGVALGGIFTQQFSRAVAEDDEMRRAGWKAGVLQERSKPVSALR